VIGAKKETGRRFGLSGLLQNGKADVMIDTLPGGAKDSFYNPFSMIH
jgi:hypothetical protein